MKPTHVAARWVVPLVVLALHIGTKAPVGAQRMWVPPPATWFPPPDRDERFGPNRLNLDIGPLGASLGYSRLLSRDVEWGLGVAGGAQTGFILASDELTGDEPVPLFAELLGGAVFIRGDIASRTELESGARVGWFYHGEYETIFGGLYTALQYRVGAVRIGPRLYAGRIAEESGRSEVAFAVVPLLLGFRWSW